jgi:thiol-disulfide isomerase/thioredoxin
MKGIIALVIINLILLSLSSCKIPVEKKKIVNEKPTTPALTKEYIGGWPSFSESEKDLSNLQSYDEVARAGSKPPRFLGIDQFGEAVDLYDFIATGRPVVIDLCALWCSACQQLNAKIANGDSLFNEMIDNQDIYWISIVVEDLYGEHANAAIVNQWYLRYAHERVPVITDEANVWRSYLAPQAYPAIGVIVDGKWAQTNFNDEQQLYYYLYSLGI